MWKYTGVERPAFAVSPKTGEESVWDHPRPPVTLRDVREVVVRHIGEIIAKSSKTIRVCETASPPTFYLPPEDVQTEYLRRSPSTSFCEWKGEVTYWSLVMPGLPKLSKVAWSYENPNSNFENIRGFFSFYPSRVDCFVEGIRVQPQPGGFYGGWITPEIVGPFKGEPGTAAW